MSGGLFPQPLLEVLARQPRAVAFEHGARTVSYGELLALVHRLVAALQAVGLAPRDCVALHTGLTVEGFAANLAAHALGCQVIAARPGWSASQLAGVLADGVDAVVGDSSTLTADVLAAADRCPEVLGLGPHPGAVDLLGGSPGRAGSHAVQVDPSDLSRITFTSGSTGRPKGCAYSYRTLTLTYQPDRRSPDLARLVTHFERFLAHTSWAMPVMATFAGRSLLNRGTVVIDDGPGTVTPEAIQRHRITAVTMPVPALSRMLAELREQPGDLPCLQAVVIGGSPASPGLLAAAVERLGPILWQGYGQAESGMISLLTPEHILHGGDTLISVGRPLPDVVISVRDDTGRETRRGEVGEICVRSPHVMAGYWKDPELTDEVLRDGWLHTRDLGRLDDDGLLQLTGRSRDVIVVNAEVCYAGAIEGVLAAHPGVEQAFVVGVPDERTGEAVHAFLLLAAGTGAPERTELDSLVRAELSPAHLPETITVLDQIPLTAGDKPDKAALALRARLGESRTHPGRSGVSPAPG